MFKALVRVSHEGLRKKHNNFNKRARIRILQSYFSAKFFDSLAHASDADAEAIRTKLSNLRSNPLPSSRTVMAKGPRTKKMYISSYGSSYHGAITNSSSLHEKRLA